MNTNLQNKTIKDSVSLNFQDSNLKVNRSNNNSTSALISKGEISRENHSPTEKCDLCCPLPKRNKATPRLKVSVEFAASQWFQILLIHINSKNKSLNGVIEPIGECHLDLTSGI